MKPDIALFAAAALASSLHAAAAQDQDLDCNNPVTQVDMNICAGEDYGDADAALNAVYTAAMTRMQARDQELGDIDPNYVGAAEALKKAQRGWIQYRDGHCDLAGFEARGGSMESMLVSNCLAEVTRKRTEELKGLTEDNQG